MGGSFCGRKQKGRLCIRIIIILMIMIGSIKPMMIRNLNFPLVFVISLSVSGFLNKTKLTLI